jgi:MarR family protein
MRVSLLSSPVPPEVTHVMLEPLLPRLKREIEDRLAELRPLVEEVAQLEAARRALLDERAAGWRAQPSAPPVRRAAEASENGGSSAAPRVAERTAPRAAAREQTAEGGEGGRAPRGANQEAILALVEERPGVSVAEIAAVTKIAKPTVASAVSKLKRDGLLADEMGGVKLASRKPMTLAEIAAAATRDEGAGDDEWEAARPRR